MILYGELPGERLDAFLSRQVEGLTRSAAQRLLEDGCVTVRDRDSMEQVRIPIAQVKGFIEEKLVF